MTQETATCRDICHIFGHIDADLSKFGLTFAKTWKLTHGAMVRYFFSNSRRCEIELLLSVAIKCRASVHSVTRSIQPNYLCCPPCAPAATRSVALVASVTNPSCFIFFRMDGLFSKSDSNQNAFTQHYDAVWNSAAKIACPADPHLPLARCIPHCDQLLRHVKPVGLRFWQKRCAMSKAGDPLGSGAIVIILRVSGQSTSTIRTARLALI